MLGDQADDVRYSIMQANWPGRPAAPWFHWRWERRQLRGTGDARWWAAEELHKETGAPDVG